MFFDIETSPNIGFFWHPGFDLTIDYQNIIKERAVICIAYKWAGDTRVYSLNWDSKQSDKTMLKRFVKLMDSADEVVTHNGERFDIKWLRTRCLKHGIPMMPNYTSVDTFKYAKGRFLFNSNKLDYISQFMGIGKKPETGFNLWKAVTLNNDKKALAKMIRYCKNDVVLLEKVWDKMNSYVPSKTSVAQGASRCPECGSDHTVVNKYTTLATGYRRITFRCVDCGKYHSTPVSKFEKDKDHEKA